MTSFLDRVRDRMAGITRPITKRLAKTRHSIATNRFDERVWAEARKTDTVDRLITDLGLGDVHHGGRRQAYDPAPELVRDLFMTLYKANPHQENERHIHPDCYPNYKIIGELLENEKLAELQDVTAADAVMSAIALEAMGDVVRDILARVPPPPPPPAPPQPAGGEPSADGEPGGSGDEPGGSGDQPDSGDGEAAQAAAQAQEQAERDWRADYDQLLEHLDLERAAMKALDAAGDEVGELETLRVSIGLNDGEWHSMSPEQRLRLAERLRTPQMRQLARTIGRMKRYALGQRATRVLNVPHEVRGVTTGNDLQHALPAQFALLATEQTSYEFYRRFAQSELLQFKLQGTEQIGRGPIVICIDKSQSMQGDKFHWAMAVAEALRRLALEEDRDYFALLFGTNADRHRFEFPKGRGPFEKVLAFLSAAADGGTAFDGVLDEALDKASTAFDGEARGKADIVFVTDGAARLTDEWVTRFNAERARVGVRVYSVYIGGAKDMTHQTPPIELLNRISDLVVPAGNLKPETAGRIFAQV